MYKIIRRPLVIPDVPDDYEHFYGNPFEKCDWDFETIMNKLAATAYMNCLAFEETWAYTYAVKEFGKEFFDRGITIIYEYDSREAYEKYGVAKISWEMK